MKCLELLMWEAKDHVNDAQRLLNAASECKHIGDKDMCKYFKNKASSRLDEYEEVTEKINDMLSDWKAAEDTTKESVCWRIIVKEYADWVLRMKYCLSDL